MADKTVKVFVVQKQHYREKKADPWTVYDPGVQEMPLSHAKALGLAHKIVEEVTSAEGAVAVMSDPYGGMFDAKLSKLLQDAGYGSLEDLRNASRGVNFRDEILLHKGIGVAGFERIAHALQEGGN